MNNAYLDPIIIILAFMMGILHARHKYRIKYQKEITSDLEIKMGKYVDFMLITIGAIPILVTIFMIFYVTFSFFIGHIARGFETSMTPTLVEGDYSFEKTVFFGGNPKRCDIIAFVPPYEKISNVPLAVFKKFIGLHIHIVAFEKRVIGLPGEKVLIKPDETGKSTVYINGKKLNEKYIITDPNNYCAKLTYGPYVVPKDSYFMLGDNREESYDSRNFGFVKRDRFISKAVFVIYPFNKIRWL